MAITNLQLAILIAYTLAIYYCFVGSGILSRDGVPSFMQYAMAAPPQTEMDALLDLKNGFNDPPELSSWLRHGRGGEGGGSGSGSGPPPHCSGWRGVTCSNNTGPFTIVSISLHNCFQGGTIRPSIANLSFLEHLDLSMNAIGGTIPAELTTLRSLVTLDLSNNRLSGGLPSDWGAMASLEMLSLWQNDLNGSIPNGLFKAINLKRLRLENNSFSGEFPEEVGSLSRLRYLAVLFNQLTGLIPAQLGNVSSLRSLYMGYNGLNGTLPESIGSLPKLARLDLQHNEIHGHIPPSWSNLNVSLQTLILSDNLLEGEIPAGLATKFSNVSFANNQDLCGPPFTRSCLATPPLFPPPYTDGIMPPPVLPSPWSRPSKSSGNVARAKAGVIGGLVGAFAVFVVLLLVFLVKKSRKRQRDGSQVQNWFSPDIQADRRHGKFEILDEQLSKYAFQDIEAHAGYFDTAHVLGKGRFATVYRSHFQDGSELAIKVFKYPIAAATFEREITMLASIKHKHLLPVKGYYSTSIEKAVIYDYFPRGTLHRLLHGDDASSPSVHDRSIDPNELPDWATRQRIAFGVAQALDYLHRGSNFRVLHMDVKSSNILLETSSLLPRLADYGIIQIISNNPESDSNDHVVETAGYTAPEVLETRKYTEKSDVYSFGVVLLELITGKLPVFEVEGERLNLAVWAETLHRDKRGREIMDPVALKTSPFPEYLDRALNLAMLCVSENPSARPAIAEVASVLEGLASNPSPLRSPDQHMIKPLLR